MATKEDLFAGAEKLKADILAFAEKRQFGDEIRTPEGLGTGVRATIVNGEESLVGHAHRFIDEAMTYVEQLVGEQAPEVSTTESAA